MAPIYHALVLNMHQPANNLEHLLEYHEWEAKEILWALDRVARSIWHYEDIARVHLALSGTLLETLSNPDFQQRVYGIVKCGDMLWHWQQTRLFEILGTGYYHPVLPLTPTADWEEQLTRWQGIGQHLFSRRFAGYWPSEMGFTMEMIPLLKTLGYRYVLVDSKHVEPIDPTMQWDEVRYRPHIAAYDGHEIIVVVRDRELSDAQESGMDYGWFEHELHERTKWCNFPPLVTTCTDGDNGGWFRNTNPKGNFWSVFYEDFMEQIRNNYTVARPILINDYLDTYGAHGYVTVNTGAWNTGWHDGIGFVQWTGSQQQKDALARVADVSRQFHTTRDALGDALHDPHKSYHLAEAHWHLLRSETSCNFYWGEAWVQRCHDDLDATLHHLAEVQR